MNELAEIQGFYSKKQIECTILTYNDTFGTWYCVSGTNQIHFTHDDLEEGVSLIDLVSVETFASDIDINTLTELETAVES